jgi:hypothetical protein
MSSLCSNATSNVLRRSRVTAPSQHSHPSAAGRGRPITMTSKFSTSLPSNTVPTLRTVSAFQPRPSSSRSALSGSLSKVRCSRSYSSGITGLLDGGQVILVGSTVNDDSQSTLYAACAAVAATVALVTGFPGGKSPFLPGGGGGGPEFNSSLMYAGGASLREETPNEGKAQISEDSAVSLKTSNQPPRFYEVRQCQMDL